MFAGFAVARLRADLLGAARRKSPSPVRRGGDRGGAWPGKCPDVPGRPGSLAAPRSIVAAERRQRAPTWLPLRRLRALLARQLLGLALNGMDFRCTVALNCCRRSAAFGVLSMPVLGAGAPSYALSPLRGCRIHDRIQLVRKLSGEKEVQRPNQLENGTTLPEGGWQGECHEQRAKSVPAPLH